MLNKKSSRKFVLIQGLIEQKIDNKITIFIPEASELITFNETGSFIFSKLKKKLTEGEIIKKLIEKYEVNQITAEDDFRVFIDQLYKKKLLFFDE
jgi:hypothetical protein